MSSASDIKYYIIREVFVKIVLISDTHTKLDRVVLPDGDLLIHAGDATYRGTHLELIKFNNDLGKIKDKFKYGVIFTPGNHDWMAERDEYRFRQIMTNATVLIDEGVKIENFNVYGSPWQPEFCDWAFNLPRNGPQLKRRWGQIPNNTDILVTHGPPYGMLDYVERGMAIEHLGCELLAERIKHLPNLKLHVFGHIHNGFGRFHSTQYIDGVEQPSTIFVNASICTEEYKPTNRPIVVEL